MEEFFANLDFKKIFDFFVNFFTELFKAVGVDGKLASKLSFLGDFFTTEAEETTSAL